MVISDRKMLEVVAADKKMTTLTAWVIRKSDISLASAMGVGPGDAHRSPSAGGAGRHRRGGREPPLDRDRWRIVFAADYAI